MLRLKKLLIFSALLTTFISTSCRDGAETKNQPITTTNASTANTKSVAPPAREVAQRENALVRILNANNNIGPVDIFTDDAKSFDDVPFKEITPFKEIPGKRTDLKVRVAGMDSSPFVTENSESLDEGKHYTVVVLPGDDNRRSDLRVLEDNIKAPEQGKVRVRFVNAVRDGGDLDILAVGRNEMIFKNLSFQEKKGFDDIAPYQGAIEIRRGGKPETLYTLKTVNFEAGKSYTIVLTGRVEPGKVEISDVSVEDKIGL
jgi:hypothetical protein